MEHKKEDFTKSHKKWKGHFFAGRELIVFIRNGTNFGRNE
jgi:hypothetical protein